MSYESRAYESVDDKSLSCLMSYETPSMRVVGHQKEGDGCAKVESQRHSHRQLPPISAL